LTAEQVAVLAAPVGRKKAIQRVKELRVERWRSYREEAEQEWKTLNKDPEFMFGLALYIGEGDKANSRIRLTNTNPVILKRFQRWVIQLGVEASRLTCATHIHENDSEPDTMKFWSDFLNIAKSKIYVYQKAPPVSSKGLRKNKHPYGIGSIYTHDTKLAQKIKTWARLALEEDLK
jgi:hypothetical protein